MTYQKWIHRWSRSNWEVVMEWERERRRP